MGRGRNIGYVRVLIDSILRQSVGAVGGLEVHRAVIHSTALHGPKVLRPQSLV